MSASGLGRVKTPITRTPRQRSHVSFFHQLRTFRCIGFGQLCADIVAKVPNCPALIYGDSWGALQIFFWAPVSINIEKRCNHYRLIVACMLSGAGRDRPLIVGWSTALRGQVINESLGQLRRNWQPARACWQGPNHHAANRGRNRVDHRTITGRSWATSVHSKPVFVCSDCTFRPGLLNRPFHCMSQKNTPCRSGRFSSPSHRCTPYASISANS